jgi:anthranilate synthase component 2
VKLLIIDNYDSFTYNLVQLVREAGQEEFLLVKNDALQQLKPADFDKVLISPGPGLAHEAGDLMPFISQYKKHKSLLGVCLGFEALVLSSGGKLSPLPQPLHGIQNEGSVLCDDPVFSGLPEKFLIGHYHSWYVEAENLPASLEVTMKDQQDRIMAFRHKEADMRGFLFHPESYMTDYGFEMISNWLQV